MTVTRLSSEQRRAPTLLASSRHGANGELLIRGHGFSRGVLASLVRRKLAAAEREVVMAGGKPIEVVRFRIAAAGGRRFRPKVEAISTAGTPSAECDLARILDPPERLTFGPFNRMLLSCFGQ
jgi:hypothetical protein